MSIVLRVYRLDYQSLGVDEIASMNGADPELTWSAVIDYSTRDQPPAFFLLLHAWLKIFPFNDFNGRMLALVIGISSVMAIFFLGQEVKNRQVGLIASLITSFSYIHIYFSQDVRFYTLVFLLSTLSYLFYNRAVKSTKVFDSILYSLSTTLLLYTHYFGLVVFASQGIIFLLLIIFYPTQRKFIVLSVLSALLVIVSIIPWIPVFFSDSQIQIFWIQPEPFYFPLKYFYVYFKDVITCFIFATLLIIYFFSLFKAFKLNHKIDRVDLILLGGVAFSFLIPIIYSILRTPLLHVRYTIIALPPLIVMICLGLSFLRASIQRIILITTCCTSLFSLVVLEKYYTKIQKEDWRGLVKGVIKTATATDVSVSRHAWYCNYYFKSLHSEFRTIQPAQLNIENEKPTGVWWLSGFDVRPTPDTVEVYLLKKGYLLKRTDSLFRARASYYKLID